MQAPSKTLVTIVPDDDGGTVGTICTAKQELFAQAFARHGNQAAAYRQAYTVHERTSLNTISTNASRLASLPHVAKRIRELQQQAALEVIVDIREALTHQLDIATANPNDIAYIAKRCCRCCYGINHKHQWVDDAEYMAACITAIDEKKDSPSDEGGYGYTRGREPNPTCPECLGVGQSEVVINDTTKLTGKALKLYKGIDIKNGELVVTMHDQQKAWEMVCRMLGGFNDKLNLSGIMGLGGAGKVEKLPDGALTEQEAARSYLELLG
jgi:phage terminase small subunit